MERLTERSENGTAVYRHPTMEPEGWKANRAAVLERCCKYEETGLTPEEIMDGKLLTGWITVEEQLPKEPDDGMIDMDGLKEYIVMIKGASVPTALYYAGGGEWYREGEFYKVLAWMPMPKPFNLQN